MPALTQPGTEQDASFPYLALSFMPEIWASPKPSLTTLTLQSAFHQVISSS